MKIFRDIELKRTFIFLGIISLVMIVVAFILNVYYGIVTLCLCCAYLFIFWNVINRKYKKIRELSDSLNKILHGNYQLLINNYEEGEIGILQSEIYKLTVRLREQQQVLENDKKFLADSIADISHQIRTPLTTINILLSLLSNPDLSEERRQSVTNELYDLLFRIEWLINTLLKMSKLDAKTINFSKENILLEDLIKKSCAPLLVPIELKNQELIINASGSFCGDLLWTSEALGNIIKNCMEHTPQDGKIEIIANENSLYSEIIISDSGKGISKEDLPHIFERFYKGKNDSEKGFGIGLALARMIVIAQNGTIKAENKASGGATFIIKFYKGTI